MIHDSQHIRDAYHAFISNKAFPCVGAKTAFAKKQAWSMVAGNMACPAHDEEILEFIYRFVDESRQSDSNFHSVAILFDGPGGITEEIYEKILWQRLQALLDLDAKKFPYDSRVSDDPTSAEFSLSLKQEAFFVIGLHPASSRTSRRFDYPALVFNPHAQFTAMKENGKYDKMKDVIRKRDVIYSGSINPMLNDHGRSSEVQQYSGRQYESPLVCPLKINHATT